MLAIRRPAAVSWLPVRKNGRRERISTGTRSVPVEGATGAGIRPLPRCGVRMAIYLVWQATERVVRGLLLPAVRLEARLPACEPLLVTQEEPRHQADAGVPAGDRERLGEVLRLLRPRDAEVRVGRPGLVAVLGDPELLGPVELRQQADQDVDVPELDRGSLLRRRARALGRPAVVRMVGIDVEMLAAQPVALERREERQRRDRWTAAARTVVAVRVGAAARHGLL